DKLRVFLLRTLFFFYLSGAHRDLHSFPTRRSSDLMPLLQDQLELFDRRLLHDDRVRSLADLFTRRVDVGASSSQAAAREDQHREIRPVPRTRASHVVGPGPEQASTSRGPQQAPPSERDLLERYETVAAALAPYVRRRPIDEIVSDIREAARNPLNTLHYLVADARTSSG